MSHQPEGFQDKVAFVWKVAEDMIVDRHQSNGMLFDAFFEKPGFRQALLEYLGGTYHEIRQGGQG